MDHNYIVVSNFIKHAQNMDFDAWKDLIDDNCEISYKFNGQTFVSSKSHFTDVLKKGHFDNTTKIRVTKTSIENSANGTYKTHEICYYERKGSGRDETGPGTYIMSSIGTIKVENGKIIYMVYLFHKAKCDADLIEDMHYIK